MIQTAIFLCGMAVGAAFVLWAWACVRLRERDAIRNDAERRWRTSL